MTPSWYLVALAFVMGGAFAYVVQDLVRTVRSTGRHAVTLDLTPAAARGDLIHLDWGDARLQTQGWPMVVARSGPQYQLRPEDVVGLGGTKVDGDATGGIRHLRSIGQP